MRRLLLLVVFAFISFISFTRAQAPAPASQPSVLAELDRDYDTLVIVPDPLPHVQRLLNAPALARVWNSGKLTSFIKKNDPTVRLPDLGAVWFLVLQANRWVPDEIAVGMTQRSWDQSDHLLRAVMLFNLVSAANFAPQLQAERVKLQPELARELAQVTIPQMRLWVRLRAEDDATQVFTLISEQAQTFAAGTPVLKAVATETTLKVSFAVADMLPAVDDRFNALRGMKLIRDRNDAGAAALADALGKLKFSAELVRHGSGLRLTFGDAPADAKAQPLTAKDLGGLFAIDNQTILFTKWDVRPLMTAAAGWIKLAEQYKDSPLAKQAPAGGFGASLRLMGEQLLQSSPRGSSRLAATEQGLEVHAAQYDLPVAAPLDQSPLVKMIPANVEAYSANSVGSISNGLSFLLSQLETRMEQQAGQMKTPRQRETGEEIEKFLAAYKKHFAPLQEFVNGDSLSWFKPGVASVTGSQGIVKRLEIRPKGDKPFIGRDLPVLEFAILGVPTTPEKGTDYVKQVYEKLANGVASIINEYKGASAKKITPPASAVVATDLGLGVPTYTFDINWLKQAQSSVDFVVEGDLRPHYFVHNGVLVFSTSPRLSKKLIETARSGKSIALPASGQGQLVGIGHFDGKLGATFFDEVAVWTKAILDQVGPTTRPPGAKNDAADAVAIIQGIGEYFALIGQSNWEEWQQTGTRTSHGNVTFAK